MSKILVVLMLLYFADIVLTVARYASLASLCAAWLPLPLHVSAGVKDIWGYETEPDIGTFKLYGFDHGGYVWEDAVEVCIQDDAHLAIIETAEQWGYLERVYIPQLELLWRARPDTSKDEQCEAMIGYHNGYLDEEHLTFYTVFGGPVPNLNQGTQPNMWHDGEPSYYGRNYTEGREKVCVAFNTHRIKNTTGGAKLNAGNCTSKLPFLCQKCDW